MLPLIFVSWINRSKSNVDLGSTFDVRLRIFRQALVAAVGSTKRERIDALAVIHS
jgi:hypothetical protein